MGASLLFTVLNQQVPEDLAELEEAAYLDAAGLSFQRQSQIIKGKRTILENTKIHVDPAAIIR